MLQPIPLARLIGTRLRTLRETANLRQEQIAASARKVGFHSWARGTVAMIESGRRRLTLEEFLLIPAILGNVGIENVELPDLIDAGAGGVVLISPSSERPF